MFASDVIKKLQRLMEKYGDVPIIYTDDGDHYVVSEIVKGETAYIRFFYEPETPVEKSVFFIS